MRAMRAEAFGRYEDLKLTDIPSPTLPDGRILVWMTAAGVTPLDHTILSGQYPKERRLWCLETKAPASLKRAEPPNFRRARG
jgi:NADPH:quinone reductase-like Zn-dependent oxidoreductase